MLCNPPLSKIALLIAFPVGVAARPQTGLYSVNLSIGVMGFPETAAPSSNNTVSVSWYTPAEDGSFIKVVTVEPAGDASITQENIDSGLFEMAKLNAGVAYLKAGDFVYCNFNVKDPAAPEYTVAIQVTVVPLITD